MRGAQSSGTEYVLPEMTTVEHLTELRRRLFVSLFFLSGGTVVGWLLVPDILSSFTKSVGKSFVFISPAEAFTTHLKIALLVGLFLSAPVILAQTWAFVLPALFPHERKLVGRHVVPSLLLFAGGVVFGYVAVYPLALVFFLGFSTQEVEPVLSVARYVAFLVGVTLPFGLVFQFPVVLVVLVRLGVVTVARLRAMRRIVYLMAFIVGAILTPPDVVSQVMMAVPAIALFEITLWSMKRGVGIVGD